MARRRNIVLTIAQRGQQDRHHVESVVEVLAETALPHHFGQVAVGGGDQPDVDCLLPRIADPSYPPALQHAEEFSLGFHG